MKILKIRKFLPFQHSLFKVLFAGVVTLALTTAFSLLQNPAESEAERGLLGLKAPSFISEAQAQGTPIQQIKDEAGIAAYFKAGSATINSIRGEFRSIEDETGSYILGSVPVPDYNDENHDVHVYVNSNGWVLAYYRKNEVAAKVFDWRYYDANSGAIKTKPERVLESLAITLGAGSPTIEHYHFAFPNANKLMLIAEEQLGVGSDSFEFNLPGGLTYYEGSWSLSENDDHSYWAQLFYDGAVINPSNTNGIYGWKFIDGNINGSQLTPDTLHTVEVKVHNYFAGNESGFAGIAIVYQGP